MKIQDCHKDFCQVQTCRVFSVGLGLGSASPLVSGIHPLVVAKKSGLAQQPGSRFNGFSLKGALHKQRYRTSNIFLT